MRGVGKGGCGEGERGGRGGRWAGGGAELDYSVREGLGGGAGGGKGGAEHCQDVHSFIHVTPVACTHHTEQCGSASLGWGSMNKWPIGQGYVKCICGGGV
jgi:hypothetical protein